MAKVLCRPGTLAADAGISTRRPRPSLPLAPVILAWLKSRLKSASLPPLTTRSLAPCGSSSVSFLPSLSRDACTYPEGRTSNSAVVVRITTGPPEVTVTETGEGPPCSWADCDPCFEQADINSRSPASATSDPRTLLRSTIQTGFLSGHGFSRAEENRTKCGLSRCNKAVFILHLRMKNHANLCTGQKSALHCDDRPSPAPHPAASCRKFSSAPARDSRSSRSTRRRFPASGSSCCTSPGWEGHRCRT